MIETLPAGTGIFFMRVGTHAAETLDQIVERKKREIEQLGYTFWGYGGSTCHPLTMVQPFAKSRVAAGAPLRLCMEEMVSEQYFGEQLSAAEFSEDGREWSPVPKEIEVRGSRYALKIRELRSTEFTLPLERTRIPVGPSSGRLGSRYVAGNIDKACLVVEDAAPPGEPENHRTISLVADILPPFALILRNFRDTRS